MAALNAKNIALTVIPGVTAVFTAPPLRLTEKSQRQEDQKSRYFFTITG
jgi:siroheme synthase